jgi:hypothetical protein
VSITAGSRFAIVKVSPTAGYKHVVGGSVKGVPISTPITRRRFLSFSGVLGMTLASGLETAHVASAESANNPMPESVSLTYSGSRLKGNFGKHLPNLEFNSRSTGITGAVAGESTEVRLQTGDNSSSTLVPASLKGSFEKQPVSLLGDFQLAPSYLFESGSISGNVGRDQIRAQVAPAPGSSSSSVQVSGSYGPTTILLHAEIAGDLSSGTVQCITGGSPVHLVAKQSRGAHRIVGTYAGPPGLLALITGSLVYFL